MEKMLKKILGIISLSLISSISWSQDISNQTQNLSTIQSQLNQAEAKLHAAKKMFNPWYAGPLLTPSAHNIPPGKFMVQPYLFVTNTYARFDENRHSKNIPDIWTVKPLMIFQMGWLDWLDFTFLPQVVYNHQSGKEAIYFGDTELQWGIQLLKEKPYRPAIRISIAETLPTGKYKKLDPKKNGIDATGTGSYETSLSFNLSKVFWCWSDHPFSFRSAINYTLPTKAHVKGFNAYGGGHGTKGKVNPGNTITIDTSAEFSFTQSWVFALDLVYTYQGHSTFKGKKGHTKEGETAQIGEPSSDSLVIAPALEYNFSDHLGFLAGVSFPLTGRNSGNSISGILTLYYAW